MTITRVVITDLPDGVYYASLDIQTAGTPIQLDARPSDAIALAIRAKVPVLVEGRVFDKSELLSPARPSASTSKGERRAIHPNCPLFFFFFFFFFF